MSENSRVNGYDTKAPTRVDTIPSRKAVRGSRSTTFTDNPEKKQKINLYVDSDDRDWLEQLEEMLRNPLFAISKLQGAGISEKQLIHSYRFQHSIGDIDFINLEAVEFGDYGIKTDLIDVDIEQWNFVVHETFSVANGFANNTSVPFNTASTGNTLQGGKTINWKERGVGHSTTNTIFLFDGQSLSAVGEPYIADVNKLNRYYDLESYIYIDTSTKEGGIIFGYNGRSSANGEFFWAGLDITNGNFEIRHYVDNVSTTVYISEAIDVTTDLWYKIRVLVQDKQVTIFWDDDYLITRHIDELSVGDVGCHGAAGGVQFDGFKMKSLPYPLIGTPQNSKLTKHVNSTQVAGIYGTQERIFTEEKVEYVHEGGQDCVIDLDMSRKGSQLFDKSNNENNALVRKGTWVDGYLNPAIQLVDGDIKINDDASLQGLSSNCLIHMRFKLTSLNPNGISTGEVIAGRDNDWAIYDYNDAGTHKIAFEINNELLIGDEILINTWYEFFFMSDSKSSFIFRRDNSGIPQPEARFLYASGSSFIYAHGADRTTETCIGSLGTITSDLNITVDKFAIYNKFIIPMRHLDTIWTTRIWKIPEDDIGNRHMKSLIFNAPMNEGGGNYSKLLNIYHVNAYITNTNTAWSTDTFSPFQKASLISSIDMVSNLDNGDIFMDNKIYEASISFWIKPTASTSINYVLISRGDSDQFGIYIRLLSTGEMSVGYGWTGSSNNSVVQTTNLIPDGSWTKIDWTFNYGVNKIYVNGKLDNTVDHSATTDYIVKGILDWYIDDFTATNGVANVDLWKMYDRALTATEIKNSFVCDPLEPYFLNKLVFGLKHQYEINDAIFIENGLFGMFISKGLRDGALSRVGSVEFLIWDNGWKSIGWLEVDGT
ncbi:hypothetical protein LCGC14_1039030 [marine sediment metagenome]|uniref:LamG-like jellyroll fold domain-containing protein n=1 Tax=marine sediment metagenome TaxID=412755 RepID=A0A0F9QAJ6_9ZZZZ